MVFSYKLTDQRDKPWAKELSEFLLILELCSLGADLGEFLLKRARKSAKNALDHEDEIRKKLDDVAFEEGKKTRKLNEVDRGKQIDEVIEEIKKIADDVIKKSQEQMWKDYKYTDLFPPPTPPEKPCFLAGTLVKTESGLIEIEKIKTGTKVLSYNFETCKKEFQTVLQTFSNHAEKYLELHTEKDILKVTGAHLFYVPNENKWIAASHLTLNMQLIDAQQNLIPIKKLEIITAGVPTYNLEVAQNHNYYVGTNPILTHNDSKKLKFSSEVIYDFEFYEYYDINNKPTYVGQTTQGLTKRADQHVQEYKEYPDKKEFIKLSRPLPRDIIINGKPGPYKMTPFEAAITEMYELNARGGKRLNGKGLFNKKNPVSKRAFDKIKKDFPNFNPCRFYV